jgi:hypothetical protein
MYLVISEKHLFCNKYYNEFKIIISHESIIKTFYYKLGSSFCTEKKWKSKYNHSAIYLCYSIKVLVYFVMEYVYSMTKYTVTIVTHHLL